jgi:hypothetical protein
LPYALLPHRKKRVPFWPSNGQGIAGRNYKFVFTAGHSCLFWPSNGQQYTLTAGRVALLFSLQDAVALLFSLQDAVALLGGARAGRLLFGMLDDLGLRTRIET